MAAVTDSEVAAVRAWATGRLLKAMALGIRATVPRPLSRVFALLVAATFAVAACRRFPADCTRGDVVRFVAQMRANPGYLVDDLDPRVAEHILLRAIGGRTSATYNRHRILLTELALIRVLVKELRLDDAGLDAVLAEARVLADQRIAKR